MQVPITPVDSPIDTHVHAFIGVDVAKACIVKVLGIKGHASESATSVDRRF